MRWKTPATLTVIRYACLILLAAISIMPFYITIMNSTHSNVEIARDLNLLPGDDLKANYEQIVKHMNIFRGFYNSLKVTIPSVVLSLYFGALTAFGFAKYKFRGSGFLFSTVLITMMIPMQLGLIGYYHLHNTLRLLDTTIPLIIPWIAHPATVFFIKMYIDSAIPDALLEAARIDGSHEFRSFNTLVLPLLTPALATLAIFNFVGSWNNYIMPLIILFSKDKFTLPLLISMLKGVYTNNYGAIYLGVTISIVPIIAVYAFFSRRIIGGLVVGSVKG
ncbi:MAG: carbohydrate ABC transporter permease [Spirochaetia bacterium]|nr:carbohydrate ABC transporter permease [Spirochaetia bacterium]